MFQGTLQPIPVAIFGITWPMVLWGLALGSIPIIIHLLHRRKYRETTWAAMRFLLEAARKHSRRIRIEQLILLAVRVLILLFLVAGLQGVYAIVTTEKPTSTGPTHHILVLDASMSMQFRPAGRSSLFDRAKTTALQIVDSASSGDAFNLALITGSSDRAVVRTAVRSRRSFRDVIRQEPGEAEGEEADSLRPTEEPGRLLETLKDVEQIVLKRGEIPAKTVYVISDFQKLTWLPASKTQRELIRKSLQAIREKAAVVLIDVGRDDAVNTAVTDLRTDQPFVIAGQPLELHSTLQNFSGVPLPGRKVELLVDGQVRDTKTVSFGPRDNQELTWIYPNPKAAAAHPELAPGEHRIEVRLQDDGLSIDNRRRLAVPVKRRLNVLLVNGRPAGRPSDRATFFVRKALQPSTSERQWEGIVQPRVITESEFQGTDLTQIDCVFLCDVHSLKRNEAEKLQAYVAGGGGLVVSLGDRVDRNGYNAILFRDGDGVLPARLVKQIGSEYGAGPPLPFDADRLNHPIVDQFIGNPGTGLDKVMTFRFMRTEFPDDASARVVLRFQNDRLGDPAVIAERFGQGRVVLVTTSLDLKWSTWAVNPSFPPLINEFVHFAVTGQWSDRQRLVGETILKRFGNSAAALPTNIPVEFPDGSQRSAPLHGRDRWIIRRGGAAYFEAPPKKTTEPAGKISAGTAVRREQLRDEASQVHWRGRLVWVRNSTLKRLNATQLFLDNTSRSGFYEVRLQPPLGRTVYYAVNVDPAESDLEHVGEAALRKETLAGVNFDFRTRWEERFRSDQVASTEQNSLTRWLLIAAFCLLLVELVMAWRFAVGLVCLYAVIAVEFTRQAALWHPLAGAAVGLLLLAGLAGLFGIRWLRRSRSPGPRRMMSSPR